MFGYACDETPELMPAPIYYAHRLVERQAHLRQRRSPAVAAPGRQEPGHDALRGRQAALRSTPSCCRRQHSPEMSDGTKMKPEFTEAVIEEIIKPVLPKEWLKDTKYLVNPTGRFVIGGPQGDCGLTGRKIIVDTYGGACPHGGGAFSGKDPSKVDRSAAYAARYVAKNVVAAGLARQCQVQVAYAIGVAKPMNITVYTEGTGVIPDEQASRAGRGALRPASEGHRADARPVAPDLREDRRLRPFRPRRAGVHAGRRPTRRPLLREAARSEDQAKP